MIKRGTLITQIDTGKRYRLVNDYNKHIQLVELLNPINTSDFLILSSQSFLREFDICSVLQLPLSQFEDHVEQFIPSHIDNKILWMITGLLEENGELLQIFRESEYKDIDIDMDHLTEELGDVLYYFTAIRNKFNISIEDIESNNVTKLNKRFPKGYYTIDDAIKKVDHE